MSKRTRKRPAKRLSLKKRLRKVTRDCDRMYDSLKFERFKTSREPEIRYIEKEPDLGRVIQCIVRELPYYERMARYGEQWVAQVHFCPEVLMHALYRSASSEFCQSGDMERAAFDISRQIEMQIRKIMREFTDNRWVGVGLH